MADDSDYADIGGQRVQTRQRGAGINEAAVAAANRQDSDRKKLASMATKSSGAGMPKASDYGGDMAAFGAAMRKYREGQNASPMKSMLKDKLAQ